MYGGNQNHHFEDLVEDTGISFHRVVYLRYGVRSKISQTNNNLIIIIVKIIIIIPCCYYTEDTERNPMNCGDDGVRGFSLSTY
jgi:hypothetical protein